MNYTPYSFLLIFLLAASHALAQSPVRSLSLKIDTLDYQYKVPDNGRFEDPLRFLFREPNAVMEVFMEINESYLEHEVELIPSADFRIIDSVRTFEAGSSQFKVRFTNLFESNFLKFGFRISTDTTESFFTIPLQPYADTYVELYPPGDELFVGEEKIMPLTSNDPNNLVIDSRWTEENPINYRFTRQGQQVRIHLQAISSGTQKLQAQISVKRPILDDDGELSYQLPPIEKTFDVKEGRLAFLQIDQQEITPPDDKKEAIEIQIDYDPSLQMNKTYRIEDQEERGGALVAELFTKNRLNNDKVLALLRIYAFHRKSEGYLYIKDGDVPRFVTNVDITPKTRISEILIQRDGEDWKKTNKVYPGESILVRLKGQGLHKGEFTFEGVDNLLLDSLIKNEQISDFRLKIPEDVATRSIEIFNHNQATGSKLVVEEYSRPREFDFISLELAGRKYNVDRVNKPIFFPETLTDLIISFNENLIDLDQFHGKQYLNIDVKVSNKEGSLIELYELEDLVVCPGSSSVRSKYYDREECSNDNINLNNYLNKKTYDLEEWSRIDIEIRHKKPEYDGKGEVKRVQIYLKREYNFDIDVSFPAGLLVFEEGSEVTNFGGVSFAMLAQFSFYKPGKIAKYRPYKIGAGFIAIDAFNFASNNERQDIGLVVIGSLYPTSSDRKLTFPLFAGFGWKIKDQKPFFLLGPGIRVRL